MGHRQRFQYRSPRFAQPGWWRRYGVTMAKLSYSYRTVSRGDFLKVYETKGLSDGGGGGSRTRVRHKPNKTLEKARQHDSGNGRRDDCTTAVRLECKVIVG